MNPRPQRTELRRRLMPREGGYDFHNSLRRLAYQLMVEGEPLASLLVATAEIPKAPERQSAQAGLQQLDNWRLANLGAISTFEAVTVRSPSQTFSVKFTPNFGLQVGGQPVAIHIWNTTSPRLEPRLVRAVLSLFEDAYRDTTNPPSDLGVLCLRTMRLVRLGDAAEVSNLGQLIATNIDGIFRELEGELRESPVAPEDRPPTPPPAG